MKYCLPLVLGILLFSCNSRDTPGRIAAQDTTNTRVQWWITTPDRSKQLQKQQPLAIQTSDTTNGTAEITIDTGSRFQSMEGFGFTLTGGSAKAIRKLDVASRGKLLQELFGTDTGSIGISFLRLSVGASDLNDSVFTYDDMPPGKTDPELQHFTLGPDTTDVIPVIKEILRINPDIHFLGSPWSPPSWMKTNHSSTGGSLRTEYYSAYAKYLVRYLQAMKSAGINVHAITPQNEPLNPANNPSLLMLANDQRIFVRDHLGPAIRASGLGTRIILYDHNADRPDYPMAILKDDAAAAFVDGSAFHLYGGDISALSKVHDAFPRKNIYFTEQYTAINSEFPGDLLWHFKNLVIGAPNNWARTVLEWNLANDTAFEPHTPGGCNTCKGALTIGPTIERNVAYYIIGHASKFVRPGSQRIASRATDGLDCTAFLTRDDHVVVIVLNEQNAQSAFRIRLGDREVKAALPGGSVASFVW